MNQTQSDLRLEQSPQPVVQPFLNLSLEIFIAITSYLPTKDIFQLRIVCKNFDNVLLGRFAERHFSHLDVLPTVNALAQLGQIAKTRLEPYIRDLRFWPSIYQYGQTSEVRANNFGNRKKRYIRIVKANDLPYPGPALPWELAANDAVHFLRSGLLQQQLITALRELRIRKITIQERPEYGIRVKEASRLEQQTGVTPLRSYSFHPRWDYACPDMMTCMANAVLAAVLETRTELSTLVLDMVQDDQMQVFRWKGCEVGAARFYDLNSLTIRTGLSELRKKALMDPNASPSGNDPSLGLSHFLNRLPKLKSLDVLTHLRCEDPLILSDILRHFRPKHLSTLSLGILEHATPELASFLTAMHSTLRDLKLRFNVRHTSDGSPTPWKDLFSQISEALALNTLAIDVEGRHYEASGDKEIQALLLWMAGNMPIDWTVEEAKEASFEDGD